MGPGGRTPPSLRRRGVGHRRPVLHDPGDPVRNLSLVVRALTGGIFLTLVMYCTFSFPAPLPRVATRFPGPACSRLVPRAGEHRDPHRRRRDLLRQHLPGPQRDHPGLHRPTAPPGRCDPDLGGDGSSLLLPSTETAPAAFARRLPSLGDARRPGVQRRGRDPGRDPRGGPGRGELPRTRIRS